MTSPSLYVPAPAADFVLPFELQDAGLRGRILRLDATSTRALAAHPLPEPAQRVLAEALALSALLGSSLRLEGRLSLQLKGEGPLDLLATDYFAGGGLRGYARLDAERFEREGRPEGFGNLTGEGVRGSGLSDRRGPWLARGRLHGAGRAG
jgi:molecular chaperone Hsp33